MQQTSTVLTQTTLHFYPSMQFLQYATTLVESAEFNAETIQESFGGTAETIRLRLMP